MDFQLNHEQQMLKDSARRYLEENCAFDQRRALIDQGAFDAQRWRTMAEFGWLGMALPERYDGLGGGPIETAILMEEMGRVLCIEPYWAVAVLAGQTIVASGDERHAGVLLPLLAAGAARPVLAHGEQEARGMLNHVGASATRCSDGWRLNGRKTLVVGGNVADSFIVSVRTSGRTDEHDGITLFLLRRDTPGLTVHTLRLIDNRWAAEIVLSDVVASDQQMLGQLGAGHAALATGHAHAMVALGAEAVGVMEKALWITRDYLKIRKQFGVLLSTFQSLQHRMSDMLIELELARGMVYQAIAALAAAPAQRERALSAMKVQVGHSGKFVCAQAIQLHGGIGVTEEYVIGHHFKRMTTIEYALGSSHAHLESLAALEGRLDLAA